MSWLLDNNIYVGTLTETDLIFGIFDVIEDFILIASHLVAFRIFYLLYEVHE